VNLPDRTPVLPGQTLIKSWLVENDGNEPWPQGTNLVFTNGVRSLVGGGGRGAVVPVAAVGERVEVSAVLEIPNQPGTIMAMFSLADAAGRQFGPRLWANLTVISDDSQQRAEQQPQEAMSDIVSANDNSAHLDRLKQLGFENEELNQALLDEHAGNVEAVIEWLRANGM